MHVYIKKSNNNNKYIWNFIILENIINYIHCNNFIFIFLILFIIKSSNNYFYGKNDI